MTTQSRKKETGRSMIEMLGVLAIIGVLSVGALSGYRMAMTRYQTNELFDYMMRTATAARTHGYTQKTGMLPVSSQACSAYLNGETSPFETTCTVSDTYSDADRTKNKVNVSMSSLPSADIANALSRMGGKFCPDFPNETICLINSRNASCPRGTSCVVGLLFKK